MNFRSTSSRSNTLRSTNFRSVGLSLTLAALLAVPATGADAKEHVVKMLNDGGDGNYMVFQPDYIKAEVGDTVKFVATDIGHNAETMPEIWPEGAAPFKGEISKDVTLTIDKPGIYGVKCLPHYILGMVALVEAGDPVNADQVKAYQPPEMAKKRFEGLAEQLPK